MKGGRRDSPAGIERWRGRPALVTGASSGIGAAIAAELGGLGMNVTLVGRNQSQLEATARHVRARGGEPLIVRCDQTNPVARERMLARARRHWGGIDVLVNCAAVRGGHSLLDDEWDGIRRAIDLNVGAALWGMRALVANLRRTHEGAVINLSSLIAHRVTPGAPAVYAATKGALRVLTDGFRAEVVARRLPIKVAMISPGLVDTPWHDDSARPRSPSGSRLPHAALRPADEAQAVRYVLASAPDVQVCDVLLRSSEQGY
jgi:NADP-dependent 3-hydroxy acid dehydrogenase YdfG